MNTTAVVDYDMGNIDSVMRAVKECGSSPIRAKSHDDFESVCHIILPGVGAFPDGMNNLANKGIDRILKEQVLKLKVPFLGICLGMQLLAQKSYEGRECAGLGWIEGEVIQLVRKTSTERVPHIGWNEVCFTDSSGLFSGIPPEKDFYFAHSYHFACKEEGAKIAVTPYCGGFISAVSKDNIYGVQFHPEKSQKYGMQLLKNFLKL